MTDHIQRSYLFKLLFKLKIYQSSGSAFQHLFNQIMTFANKNFQAIAPYGNWGDGGNDGWDNIEGHYYQVFAPTINSSTEHNKICKKATDDFQKLLEKWTDIIESEIYKVTFIFFITSFACSIQALRIFRVLLNCLSSLAIRSRRSYRVGAA